MLLEKLGQLKKLNDVIGIRTLDVPACSIVPQPILRREMNELQSHCPTDIVLLTVSVKDIGKNSSQQTGKAELSKYPPAKHKAHSIVMRISMRTTQLFIRCAV
jgi:hypothetical protein